MCSRPQKFTNSRFVTVPSLLLVTMLMLTAGAMGAVEKTRAHTDRRQGQKLRRRFPSPKPWRASGLIEPRDEHREILGTQTRVPPHAAATGVTCTEEVSRSTDGGKLLAPADCGAPAISADGRYVVFVSDAVDLTPGSPNGGVYVRDRFSNSVEFISASNGERPSISADGRYVAFVNIGVQLKDRQTGRIETISVSDGGQFGFGSYGTTAISADGRYVAFDSNAETLVPGDTNGWTDIFVRDRVAGHTERVSLANDGSEANNPSGQVTGSLAISADGRYIAFSSVASNLVPGDTNGEEDTFVRDRQTGRTERVNSAEDGSQSAEAAGAIAMSGDGRYVVWQDRNANHDAIGMFLRDRQTGQIERVSVSSVGAPIDGTGPPVISSDGRFVAFASGFDHSGSDNRRVGLAVRDRQSGQTALISSPDDGSRAGRGVGSPAINVDARFVAYVWTSENGGGADILLDDRQTGTIQQLNSNGQGSGGSTGAEAYGGVMSADARFITFVSNATNLVPGDTNKCWDIYVRDRQNGTTERVSLADDGSEARDSSDSPAISADGRYVAFSSNASNLVPGDTDLSSDVFVRDRATGRTERVSLADDGSQDTTDTLGAIDSFSPSISADGRYVAFLSSAKFTAAPPRFGAIYVRDRVTGHVEQVNIADDGSQGDSVGFQPVISGDGRYVAFVSDADNLVPGDTNQQPDVFVRDRLTHHTERINVAGDGTQADGDTGGFFVGHVIAMTPDGRFVAFASDADNLVPGDTNQNSDVFVRDRQTGHTERVSLADDGSQALPPGFGAYAPDISADGRYVTFLSNAADLVANQSRRQMEVFVRDRQMARTQRISLTNDGQEASADSGFVIRRVQPNSDTSFFTPMNDVGISGDGRYVAFSSRAMMVPNQSASPGVFVRDRLCLPQPPTSLSAFTVSRTEISLSWNAPVDQDFFEIQRRTDGVPYATVATISSARPGHSSQYSDTQLIPGTKYTYQVRAINVGGASGYSNEAAGTTQGPPLPPTAPTALTATAVSASAVRLNWQDNSNNEDGFHIQRATTSGEFDQVGTVASGQTLFTDTDLLAHTSYTYRITAFNAGGASSPSSEAVAITLLPSLPAAPSNLSAAPAGATSIRLSWQDNSNNEDGFNIERATTGGAFVQVVTAAAGQTAYFDGQLLAHTLYTYRVTAFNAGGVSSPSNEAGSTTLPAPTGRLKVAKSVSFGVTVHLGAYGRSAGAALPCMAASHVWTR